MFEPISNAFAHIRKRIYMALFHCFVVVFDVHLYDIVFHDGGKSTRKGGIPNLAATMLFFTVRFSFKKDRIFIFFSMVQMFNFLFTPAIISFKIETVKCEMIL